MDHSDSSDKKESVSALIRKALQLPDEEVVVEEDDQIQNFLLGMNIVEGDHPVTGQQLWHCYLKWVGDRDRLQQTEFYSGIRKILPNDSTSSGERRRKPYMLNKEPFVDTEEDKWRVYKQLRELRVAKKEKTKNKSKV